MKRLAGFIVISAINPVLPTRKKISFGENCHFSASAAQTANIGTNMMTL